MCVVSGYEKKDPDPTGGFPTGLARRCTEGHLQGLQGGGRADVVLEPVRRARHAQRTNQLRNCIGCRQHAGTQLRSEAVLADDKAFPNFGRTKTWKNFPSDYVFAAVQPPESIANIMQIQVEHFDTVIAKPSKAMGGKVQGVQASRLPTMVDGLARTRSSLTGFAGCAGSGVRSVRHGARLERFEGHSRSVAGRIRRGCGAGTRRRPVHRESSFERARGERGRTAHRSRWS